MGCPCALLYAAQCRPFAFGVPLADFPNPCLGQGFYPGLSLPVALQGFFEDEVLETFATPWLSVLLMIAYTIMLLIVLFNMLVRAP